LMTHFASAADYGSLQTDHQESAFLEMRDRLGEAGVAPAYLHTSSTNAIAYGRRGAWHNMVRAGHAIYGYLSPARGDAPPRILHVKPALEWKAKIVMVKDVPEGALIGYGGTFRAPRPMRIGVLAVGYADGLPHRLSNKGRILASGAPAAIVGTVSMDLTTIDLGNAPSLKPGDEVTILGQEGDTRLDAQQIARLAGTISYNILCGIGARVKRVYVE
jgi:alanine racemase